MLSALESLHWLRPQMIWAAPLLLLLVVLLSRGLGKSRQWRKHIDPQLLPYLLQDQRQGHPRLRLTALLGAALLTQIALLGPAWQQAPVALYKNEQALVVVLDLSPSMLAEDIQPSRIAKAKFKLRDMLKLRQDGQTGLVVYSGDAFVVAPLTDDNNTLLTLIPGLDPTMMPVPGSNPHAGLEQAITLLKNAGGGNGAILLISDGIEPRQQAGLEKLIDSVPYPVSILAVGSRDGAPIPLPQGGFARNAEGSIVVPTLRETALRELAARGGGQYRRTSLDDSDIQALLPSAEGLGQQRRLERQFDQWQDGGHWFVLLLLPLALLCFRRSWLASLVLLMAVSLPTPDVQALEWKNLWSTPDQQGAALMENDPAAAAERFADPMWRGSAHYRAGNYQAAAEDFAQRDSATAHYNRGNALARAGDLDAAIAAYDKALEKDPALKDARANRQLLEDLQRQQEQKNQDQEKEDKNQDQSQDQDQQQPSQNQDPSQPQDGDQAQDGSDSRQQDKGDQGQQGQDSQPGNNGDNPPRQSDGQGQGDEQQPSQPEAKPDGESDQQARDEAARQHAQGGRQDKPSKDQQAQPGSPQSPQQGGEQQQAAQASPTSTLPSEEDQAQEQWLRNIPDNPQGLLQRKFQYQSRQRGNRDEISDDENYAPY